MVVQHNLTAMNSNRMLGITTGTQAKSTEKLSSGYKINRAADDAAGLSISEKMRKQIRGLTQASLNAEDGISAVQTAEGALNEVQDMLQRMNELAVKAANGTMSENDRSYIQNEIDQLETEIDRVAETTKFNETYLLKGDKTADAEYSFSYATLDAHIAAADGVTLYDANGEVVTEVAEDSISDAVDAGTYFTGKAGDDVQAKDTDLSAIATSAGYVDADAAVLYDADGNEIAEADLVNYLAADGKVLDDDLVYTSVTGTGAADETSFAEVEEATAQYYDKDGNKISANALSNYFETTDGTTVTQKADTTLYDKDGNALTLTADDIAEALETPEAMVGALELTLHVGADATTNNQISIDLHAMSSKGLGVEGLKVDGADDTNALAAIDTIKEAIQKVSTQRSALGAVQNRLEHTIANLDNVVENTTAAESQIRDTDMATEMVKYSNNNILAQAGQAMLAQANQANQGVLSLLG